MPTYFWVAQSANLLTAIISLAALLLAVWLGPRRRTNLSFAAFLTAIITWMACSFTVRLLVYVPGLATDPTPLLQWATLGFATMGLPLFWFIDSFYPIPRRVFWVLSVLGVAEVLAALGLLFGGQIISDPRPTAFGQYTYNISPVGYGLSLVHFFFEFTALGILVRHKAWRTSRSLLIGTLLITLSSVATVVQFSVFPFQTYGMALGALFLAYEVLKQQLFNPLIVHNQRLELEVAERTAELRHSLAERERVQGELRVARMIQLSLLPQALPEHPALEMWGQSLPAEEVGGDFFSYRTHGAGRLSLAVGDISGKGVPAAMLMALTLNSFETLAASAVDPGQLLTELNIVLAPRMRGSRMNAAILCASIDSAERQVRVANAGLIAPLRWRAGHVSYIESAGLPLGVQAAEVYATTAASLLPGDRLLLVSDGAVEAMNEEREMFGFQRLEETFAAAGGSAAAIGGAVLDAIAAFTGATPPHDDITIVVIAARRPEPAPAI